MEKIMPTAQDIARLQNELNSINKDFHPADYERVSNELNNLLYSFKEVDDSGNLQIKGQDFSSSSLTSNFLVNITYESLTKLISGATLIPSQMYLINDYQTVHIITNTSDINTGEIEPLIVTAISTNELSPIAYSRLYPDDIIYYNPVNDNNFITGSTKGFIYRRIDTKQNNDFPIDFRAVKYRRWQISQPSWLIGTTYTKGSVVKKPADNTLWISLVNDNTGNTVDTEYWRQFEWDNLSYVSPTADSWYIVDDAFQVILTCTALYEDYKFISDGDYSTCYSNKCEQTLGNVIDLFNNVVKGANFYYNSIGTSFNSNSIGAGFNSNSIGTSFYNNSIGARFNTNSIGANFSSNSIGTSFYYNSIGAGFGSNSIGTSFNTNSIGANFSSNSIGTSFYFNSIGNNITSFTCLLSGIIMNTFEDNKDFTGIDFSLATHIIGAYNCRIYADKTDGIKLSYMDGGVTTKVAVNA